MSKVYLITRTPFPFGNAATNRVKCYAKALACQDVDCEVIIYQRNDKNSVAASGMFENIRYRYISGVQHRHSSHFVARWNDLKDRFRLCIFLMINVKAGDRVFFYELIPFVSLLTFIVHFKAGKSVGELCEYPYVASKHYKWIKQAWTQFILRVQFKMYDGIIAISDTLLKLAEEKASCSCNKIKIPILVDLERFNLSNSSESCTGNDLFIFHSGTLTEQKDGILGMITAFGETVKTVSVPIKFYITGSMESSPHKEEIRRLMDKYCLNGKLVFTGYLSEEELVSYLKRASFVIINKYPTIQNIFCFSTKLGEYMAMEKVVIITKVGEAVNWLHDMVDCYFVEPNAPNEISKAIIELINNSQLYNYISKNARLTCENSFSYHLYGKKLKEFFNGA